MRAQFCFVDHTDWVNEPFNISFVEKAHSLITVTGVIHDKQMLVNVRDR